MLKMKFWKFSQCSLYNLKGGDIMKKMILVLTLVLVAAIGVTAGNDFEQAKSHTTNKLADPGRGG